MIRLPGNIQLIWQSNRHFIRLVTGMVLLFSVLKIIFYQYNSAALFAAANSFSFWKTAGWSLLYDLLITLFINIPFLFSLALFQRWRTIGQWLLVPFFTIINLVAVLFNVLDIFYFPFHFQKATADLLHVIDHPFAQLLHFPLLRIITFLAILILLFFFILRLCQKLYQGFGKHEKAGWSICFCFVALVITAATGPEAGRKLVPTYPLISINSTELVVAENSFHTFCYSLLRKGQEVPEWKFISKEMADQLFPVSKRSVPAFAGQQRKNIVLFIMESIPYDFFDSSSRFKVAMPFFDSISGISHFFRQVYAYSHQSNKGITALLAGIPTLTDIPVYHTQFVNMPVTKIGSALRSKGYGSFFCIGDDYDNFGFAKCTNWMGFDKYYSKQDIPGYRKLPANPMGIHDEYVLEYFRQKIDAATAPFFAVQYNTSTHYPYELPVGFKKTFPPGYTDPMKAMAYYDHSLQLFFNKAQNAEWFANTIFIFCSDHWLPPDDNNTAFNNIDGYHIPVIIYDPSQPLKQVNKQVHNQFDIPATILSIAGYDGNTLGYGNSILDTGAANKYAFSRISSTSYQVIDSAYVLGWNTVSGKTEYLYHYSEDTRLHHNHNGKAGYKNQQAQLEQIIRAFLQQAAWQYNGGQ